MYKFLICLIFTLILAPITIFSQSSNPNTFLSKLELPKKLELCGERIPLEIPEVKERAEREFYLLLQQPGQIIMYFKRSGYYFPIYEKMIKELDLPMDLKFLSVAESALYQSKSSVGAIGLWQFMEGTAKLMGLEVNDLVDERRNIEKSTWAALNYLKQNHKSHKYWAITLAAYNMGMSGIADNVDFQGSEDYFDLYLNEETSRFIFRIAIIKEIMSNPSKYGFELDPNQIYKLPKTKKVEVVTEISDLSQWAKSQGSSYKDIKILNPWILKRSLPKPSKGKVYEILVPVE